MFVVALIVISVNRRGRGRRRGRAKWSSFWVSAPRSVLLLAFPNCHPRHPPLGRRRSSLGRSAIRFARSVLR
jgi:hypothetical protein